MNRTPVLVVDKASKFFRVQKVAKTVLGAMKAAFHGPSLHMSYSVIENISFQVFPGERLALLGRNGSGKSTLMRLIAGIFDCSSGSISHNVPSSAVFTGETGLNLDLTVTDNIELFGAIHGIPKKVTDACREEILALADLLDLRYATVQDLSSGQRRRLALAIFFHADHGLILLDEALSHLDAKFAVVSEARFRDWAQQGKALLVVSHDMDFIRRFCDRALWISGKNLKMIGPVNEVVDAYEKGDASSR